MDSLDTLSAGLVTANLSIAGAGAGAGLHTRLARLQLTSPTFQLCGQQFTLALLLHQPPHSHPVLHIII